MVLHDTTNDQWNSGEEFPPTPVPALMPLSGGEPFADTAGDAMPFFVFSDADDEDDLNEDSFDDMEEEDFEDEEEEYEDEEDDEDEDDEDDDYNEDEDDDYDYDDDEDFEYDEE